MPNAPAKYAFTLLYAAARREFSELHIEDQRIWQALLNCAGQPLKDAPEKFGKLMGLDVVKVR